MHSYGAGRVEFDKNTGIGISRVETGGLEGLLQASIKDIVGLFEAVDCSKNLLEESQPKYRQGGGASCDFARRIEWGKGFMKKGAINIEVGDLKGGSRALLLCASGVCRQHSHLASIVSCGSIRANVGIRGLTLTVGSEAGRHLIGDGRATGLEEELAISADSVGFDVVEVDRTDSSIFSELLIHLDSDSSGRCSVVKVESGGEDRDFFSRLRRFRE